MRATRTDNHRRVHYIPDHVTRQSAGATRSGKSIFNVHDLKQLSVGEFNQITKHGATDFPAMAFIWNT